MGWSVRFLRHRTALQKLFNPPRSELTKKAKITEHKISFRIMVLTEKMSGQLPDSGLFSGNLRRRHSAEDDAGFLR